MALLDNKKTKMLLVAAVGAFALSAGAVAKLTPVSAEVAGTDIASFVMQDGAGVRTDDKKAIRFTTAIDKEDLNALIDQNEGKEVAVVTMITPTNVLGETALTNETFLAGEDFSQVETVKFRDDRLTAVQGKWDSEKEVYDTIVNGDENAEYDKYVFRACLYDIQDANLTYDFSARSYITVNGVVYDYTDYNATNNSRNIWNVAKNALENGNYTNDENVENEPYDNLSLLCAEYDVKVTNGYTGEEKTFTVKRGDKISYENATEFDAFTANVEYQAYLKDLTTSEGVYGDSIVTSDLELTANYRSLAFTLNADEQSYTASLGSFSSADSKIIQVPATWKDLPVTVFDKTGDNTRSKYTRAILPASVTSFAQAECFYGWSSLKYIAMPGITTLQTNDFLACNALETAIVGATTLNTSTGAFVFHNYGETKPDAHLTLYTTNTEAVSWSLTARDDMWNGKVVSYSETDKCGKWRWANEAYTDITVNENTHSYDSETGVCANCGDFKSYGITYEYVEATDTYKASVWDQKTSIVKIYESYDDGVHGRKDVTAIEFKMFYISTINRVLTELYLPETITTMPHLELCYNVTVLSMPGVTSANQNDGYTNSGYRLTALRVLIVGSSFSSDGQVFYITKAGAENQATVYTTATSDATISFTGTNNNIWNGTTVYYSEDETEENTWQWADDGMGIVLNGTEA